MSGIMSYDYIIAGGGTAGLVLAHRLTEAPSVSVVVVEAGGDASSDPRVLIPALFTAATGSDLDWGFGSVAQEGLDGRKIGQTQGKALGGSSAVNAQCLIPPSQTDLNNWEAVGNKGWGWSTIKNYITKPFKLRLPDAETVQHLNVSWADDLATSTSGPLSASFTDTKENPIGNSWINTFANLGHDLTQNPFGGHSTGPYNSPATVDAISKTRSYSGNTYYATAKDRPNLVVLVNSTVEKIILEPSGNGEPKATGVQLRRDNKTETITAKREVIISAGAFNSPKLLELSGIGDPDVLSTHGIEVLVENAHVGTNLQDHVLTGISYEAADGIFTGDDLMRGDPNVTAWAMDLYTQHQAGPFASSGITPYAYLPTADFANDSSAKSALLSAISGWKGSHPLDAERAKVLTNLIENGNEATGAYLLFPA